jgi:hypothetical protein
VGLDRLEPPRGLRCPRLYHPRRDDGRVRAWDTEQDEAGEGDFIYIPEHLIHREVVAAEGGEGVVVRVGGVGASVFNVEGPDPAT